MSRCNLPFKMLWEKIKANIHMPCSVQSPQAMLSLLPLTGASLGFSSVRLG